MSQRKERLLDYFNAQLETLRNGSKQFAEQYPTQAQLLGTDSDDPDVNRLLEGVAFLTAQLQQRLEQEQPLVLQAAAQKLSPAISAPLPSATIIGITPTNSLKSVVSVSTETTFDTKVNGERDVCRFSAVWPLRVMPILSTGCQITQDASRIQLQWHLKANADFATFERCALSFFLNAPYETATDLYQLFSFHLNEIVVIEASGERHSFAASHLKVKSQCSPGLYDYGRFNPIQSLVLDYCLCPEKLFIFELSELIFDTLKQGNQLLIEFHFDGFKRALPEVNAHTLSLNPVPVINQFTCDTDPISTLPTAPKVAINAHQADMNQGESLPVVCINQVKSVAEYQSDNIHYDKTDFTHIREPDTINHRFFDTLYLAPREQAPQSSWQVINANVTCTNGTTAANLRPGSITVKADNLSPAVSFKNLIPISQYVPPRIDSAFGWRLIEQAASTGQNITNKEQLLQLLHQFIPEPLKGTPKQRANLHRFASIESLTIEHRSLIINQGLVHGTSVQVNVNGSHFSSEGDYFLFCDLLRRLFAVRKPMNQFLEFCAVDPSSGNTHNWPTIISSDDLC